ncbi:hypothetical protein GCM10009555_052480 [Acrocarpospora macrocephala]
MTDVQWGGFWFACIVIFILVMAWNSGSRHPKSKCGRCDGSGKLYSAFLPWRWRDCPNCKGGTYDRSDKK